MPEASTKLFGSIRYEEGAVLKFPCGLPAFESERRFLAIDQPVTAPFVFLQSLSNPDLCFATLPITAVDSSYELAAPAEDLEALGLTTDRQPAVGSEVLCFVILSIEPGRATANLLAPVIVNLDTRTAVQAVRMDSRYSHQHPLDLDGNGEAAC